MNGTDDVWEWLNPPRVMRAPPSDEHAGCCRQAQRHPIGSDSIRREELFAEAISYRRKDVRCLTAAEETALVDAMTTLAANGTWGAFVDRHGRQGAGIHGTLPASIGRGGSGAHGSHGGSRARAADASGAGDSSRENAMNRFLPWHRLFLLEFEDELRAIDPEIAIPYWCWSEQASLPALMSRTPLSITGTSAGTSTVGVTRTPGTGAVTALPATSDVATVMAATDFRSFTEALENIHNTAHAWVGGTMNNVPISPADPIFWLVHAEVDRIWTRWTNSAIGEQARLRRENRPVIVGGSRELPGINMARRKNRVPSLITTTRALNLGYGYDRLEDGLPTACARP